MSRLRLGPGCPSLRSGWGAWVLAGTLVYLAGLTLLTACNSNARAQPMPTVPPQPTLDRTMDAVVRGLVTVVRPTSTRPTSTRATPEPTAGPPRPVEPRQIAPAETGPRTAPATPALQAAATARATDPPERYPSPVQRLTATIQAPAATTSERPPSPRPTTGGVAAPGAARSDQVPAPLRGTAAP